MKAPKIIAAVAVGFLGATLFAAPASSAEPDAPVTPKVRNVPRAELATKAKGAALARKMESEAADLLDSAVRMGKRLDRKQVEVLTDEPTGVVVATSEGVGVDRLIVQEALVDGALVAQGVGAVTNETGSGSEATTGATGFAGGPSTTGYLLNSSDVMRVSVSQDPDVNAVDTTANHFVETWYWKYVLPERRESAAFTSSQRSGSDFWAYARRGVAEGATDGHLLRDLTIRSRPWGGTMGRMRNLLDRAPVAGEASCAGSGSLSFSYGGAQVSLPVSTGCEATKGVTGSNVYEFGTDWDGSTSSRRAVEALQSVKVNEGSIPVYADYIWATFWYKYPCPCGASVSVNVKWNDTGW